jgi:plasmid stability protein
MAEVRVRKVEEWVIGWFRSQAKKHGKSLEGELRQVLIEAVQRRKQEIAADLRADLKQLQDKFGTFSDSAPLIRDARDTRG